MREFETPWKKLILATLLTLISLVSSASHIVGGEMSYSCLGNNYYKLTLRYYRDCNGVVMPKNATIHVANPAGTVLQTFTVNKGPVSSLNISQPGCGQPTPSGCIETSTYEVDSVYLPAGPSFYVIYNQECCRNNNVSNIPNAWSVGATFPAYLYPATAGSCNNSPAFGVYPPVAVPSNVPMNMPLSMTDADGDSLYYQLCAPLSSVANAYPFTAVNFSSGYSASNMINASPALSVDPVTGNLKGTPTQIGTYAIGICIYEYRNGNLVGKVRRDYQFVVVSPWALFATITSKTDASCGSGGSATVTASGKPGPYTYSWSHGPSTATVSNLSAGTYTVTVSNGSCSDTAIVKIKGGASFTTTVTNQTDLPCGANSGASATISISGGASPYSILWPSGPGGLTNNQLSLGSNKVVITDANGCKDSVNIQINQSGSGIQLTLDSVKATSCNVAANGYAAVSASGGNAPFTFSWSDAGTGNSRTGLATGSYGVKVTDANGCSDSIGIVVNAGSGFNLAWDSIHNISCYGGADGYLSAMVSGGIAPYTYSWNVSSLSGNIAAGIPSGNYILTVTDAAGCIEVISSEVLDPDSLNITISAHQNPTCFNATDGSISIAVSGGKPPYIATWNSNLTGTTINNLGGGNYTVVVTDANGCSRTKNVTLVAPDSLSISLNSLVDVSCASAADGRIAVNVSGGTAPYSYHWNTNQTSAVISSLSSGVYRLTVTDANNCTATGVYTVSAPPAIVLSLNSVTPAYCGGATGQASVNASGGRGALSISWSSGANGLSASGLLPGSYTVTAQDSSGCSDTLIVVIPSSNSPVLNIDSLQQPACGVNDGYAQVSVSGGQAPYTFQWSNAANGNIASGLAAGTYYVIVTDNKGCSDSISFNLASISGPVISLQQSTNPSCHGATDGSLGIQISGGTPPYNILWSTSDTISTLNNLGSGSYGVTVTDGRGCSSSATYTLSQPDSLVITLLNKQDVYCNGDSTGALSVAVNGGVAPYTYQWSNGGNSSTLSSLDAGNYNLTVIDSNGCSVAAQYTILEPTTLTLSIDSISPAACGLANGMARVIASGGGAPYSIMWSNATTGNVATNLAGGVYTATVTDSLGCTASVQVVISAAGSLVASIDTLVPTSCGLSNGMAGITVSGGQQPYSYRWSNGSLSDTAQGLSAGAQYVVVSDALGCKDSINFVISSPAVLQLSLDTMAHPSCFGSLDGYLKVSVSGGYAPYHILWSTSDTVSTLNNLGSGSYGVTVTDSRGCSFSASYLLQSPDSLFINLVNQQNVLCFGDSTGVITTSVQGGTAPYTYQWSNGQADSSASNLVAGIYGLIVTDANGCSAQQSFTISQPLQTLQASVDSVKAETCGMQNGEISISISGGNAPYLIQWNNNQNGASITNLVAGVYSALVSDAHGCTDFISVTVPGASGVAAVMDSLSSPICPGEGGFAKVNAVGGVAPYTYVWDGLQGVDTAMNLSTGAHYVLVQDALGCKDSISFQIGTPDSIQISLQNLEHAECHGLSGTIQIAVSGGNAPYTMQWNNQTSGNALYHVPAGSYTVNVTDNRGCTASATYVIEQPDSFAVIVDSIIPPTCAGESDGEVILRAWGNGHIASIQTNKGKVGNSGLSELGAGKYSIYVQDTMGCGVVVDFEITDPEPLVVQDINIVAPGCDATDLGFIELMVAGGKAPYSYLWSDGTTTLNHFAISPGNYTLEVTDASGCSTHRTFEFTGSDIELNVTLEQLGCVSYADGEALVEVTGAAKPFVLKLNGETTYEGKLELMAGHYVLELTDAAGCTLIEEFSVEEAVEPKVFFADAFTPNGDGTNDAYRIDGSRECFTNARMEIHSRWGQKVFETDNPFEVYWDGRVNGSDPKSDVYIYIFISDQLKETGQFKIL